MTTKTIAKMENADDAEARFAEASTQRAQAQADAEQRGRETAQARRGLFTAFKMWAVCPAKTCRRAKACRGDATRCLNERWRPLVPAEMKAHLHKIFANQADGMTQREAIAAAGKSMAAYRRNSKVFEAAPPSPQLPPPSPSPPRTRRPAPPRTGPRVRGL